MRLAQLCREAGLPDGVLNVVNGGPEVGEAIIRHPDVRKVSFTGGPAVGSKVMALAAESLTRVVMELGGKSANLIFADVDNSSRIAQEEVFGPVLSIIRFQDEEDAVAIANDSRFGLAAYLHTKDLSRAHRVAEELDASWIAVNSFPPSNRYLMVTLASYGQIVYI
jgi:acyl-CoA reductase-like NAD-dependent aldehyde dehydrogenase